MSINRNLAIKLTAKQGGFCGLCGRNLSARISYLVVVPYR